MIESSPANVIHSREGESLFGFWWRHHVRAVESTRKTFGLSMELFDVAVRDPLWRAATQLSMGLDNVFFPEWRQKTVKEPVFIVGHPRSGTTMLQRCLTQTDDFVVFQLWHLLFPSLTARKLIGPIVRDRIREGKDVLVPGEVGHSFALGEDIVFSDSMPASLRYPASASRRARTVPPAALRTQRELLPVCRGRARVG